MADRCVLFAILVFLGAGGRAAAHGAASGAAAVRGDGCPRDAGVWHGPPRVHLVLNVEAPAIPPRVVAEAVAEAASIWSRYGVAVVPQESTPLSSRAAGTIALAVVVASQHADRLVAPLGAIGFSPEGEPGNVITIYYEDLIRFSRHLGAITSPEPEWPSGKIEQVAGRVLGRVLAHELGHFLLRSPSHATSGLMRSVQSAPDLCLGTTSHFLLSDAEVERLDRLLGRSDAAATADGDCNRR